MIVLVRHGQTLPNKEGRLLGRADPPLTELGARQAEAIAELLAGVDAAAVVSSPLQRAQATAAAVAARLGLPVATDDRLVEVDYGELDGMRLDEVPADLSARWRADASFRPPGGESLEDVHVRMAQWCEERLAAGETVVAVSHVSPIKAAVAWAMQVPAGTAWRMFLGPASVTRIGVRGGQAVLLSFNEQAHLEALG